MSHSTKENTAFNKALTIVTNKVGENRRTVTAAVTVVTVATLYRYRHEISSWSFSQAYKLCNWWKGDNPDN